MKDVTLIIYPAIDLAKAKQFFRELTGADPYVDGPQYVGYKNGDMEIGLVPNKEKRDPVALAYWTVSDIAASVKALEDVGGTVVQAIKDVGYRLLVASVKDPNGAVVGLRQMPKG
ncbi:MAG TPA: VOC family protein [Gemmatimonadaceae bacterium]